MIDVSRPLLAAFALSVALVAPARAAPPSLRRIATAAELPKGVTAPKGFLRALAWSDSAGENVLAFAAVESKGKDSDGNEGRSASLTALHLAIATPGAAPRTVRKVSDGVEPCPLDMTAEFVGAAEAVTDLDGDGLGEATFAYRTSCKGDVSPDTLKLLVLEGGEKYILRGEDVYELEAGKRAGGAFKPDPAPTKWPPAFLEHARSTWKKILKGSGTTGAVTPARAKDDKVLVDTVVECDLATIDAGGRLGATKDVTVRLRCAGTGSVGDDLEVSCDSELVATTIGRRGRRELARLDNGVSGIRFRAAGGNNGSLALSRFDLGEAGAGPSFAVVESRSREGDESSEERSEQTFYALRGDTLVEVLSLETAYDKSGPETRGIERATTLERGRKATSGVPNVIATTVETELSRSGRRRVVSERVATWAWDPAAGRYAEKPRATTSR